MSTLDTGMPSGDPERFVLINFKLKDAKINSSRKIRSHEKWQWYPTAKAEWIITFTPTKLQVQIRSFTQEKKEV
jgi:hypothetical protein